jgi:hypothetical protein
MHFILTMFLVAVSLHIFMAGYIFACHVVHVSLAVILHIIMTGGSMHFILTTFPHIADYLDHSVSLNMYRTKFCIILYFFPSSSELALVFLFLSSFIFSFPC